ncbi:YeaC family protein [Thalassotalea crassostreae]|uniref:YeaC family protein n=1 Tax=Thalassotalea crassostreae TaxID=1763536 RepID=UPI000839A351|nr:DUF1315 family protein [Thalassotalea crassostreae]
MNVIELVDNMSEEMYLRLKHAAETGKWPEGTPVEQAQRDSAMQLSMAYQARKLDSDQMLTIGSDGEIVHKSKAELKQQFKKSSVARQDSTDASKTSDNIARFTDL